MLTPEQVRAAIIDAFDEALPWDEMGLWEADAIDQNHLPAMMRQCEVIMAEYPVRVRGGP